MINGFAIINGTITDYNNNVYTNGLLFFVDRHRELQDDADKSDILVAYPLNSNYNTLKGKIVIPKERNISTTDATWCNSASNDVLFYGDGKLLYKATGVTSSMPFSFDLNIKGVNQLVVKIKCAQSSSTHIALTDLALYK